MVLVGRGSCEKLAAPSANGCSKSAEIHEWTSRKQAAFSPLQMWKDLVPEVLCFAICFTSSADREGKGAAKPTRERKGLPPT